MWTRMTETAPSTELNGTENLRYPLLEIGHITCGPNTCAGTGKLDRHKSRGIAGKRDEVFWLQIKINRDQALSKPRGQLPPAPERRNRDPFRAC